jgi:hypothetical protein
MVRHFALGMFSDVDAEHAEGVGVDWDGGVEAGDLD